MASFFEDFFKRERTEDSISQEEHANLKEQLNRPSILEKLQRYQREIDADNREKELEEREFKKSFTAKAKGE